jgi:hypothetical protein
MGAVTLLASTSDAARQPALGPNVSESQLGQPTSKYIATIVEQIRKYSPTLGWYVNAADFEAALDQAGLLPGMSAGPDENDDTAYAADLTTPTTVTRDQAALWGNVNSSGGQPPLLGHLPINTRVGWRYNYNSDYADVLWYQPSEWGFILRGSIACCKNDGSPN